MKFLMKLFSGSGAVKSIENIASEWIETSMESAEAKVLMVKTLDPNGMMRRNLSSRVADLYTLYIVVSLCLLFIPISTLFTIIVTASFGVNYTNTKSGK